MLFINTLHKNKTVFKQSPFKSEIGQTEEKKGQFWLFFLNFTPFLPLFSFNIPPYLLFLASLPAHFSARGVQLHTKTLPNGATQETRKRATPERIAHCIFRKLNYKTGDKTAAPKSRKTRLPDQLNGGWKRWVPASVRQPKYWGCWSPSSWHPPPSSWQ